VPWLDRLAIAPLAGEEARALLGERVAPIVAERLLSTAAGNPLALLEIPRLLSAAQPAGREPLEDPLRPDAGRRRARVPAPADALDGLLSPKTIEYHQGQIYRKLDLRGRAELARFMALEG
jgi:hypothetical protein